ncbi:hypothetical protein L0337_25080 [candidate division KSB1 bacterium]|nr:hypothetical protein [candidate division KSB1 bacterium]
MRNQLIQSYLNIMMGKPVMSGTRITVELNKFLVAMTLLVFAVSIPPLHAQVSRSCRWNVSAVPVYIDLTSFDLRGWDREHIIQEVINATTVWNTEAGGVISLYYAGDRAVSPVYNDNLGKIFIFAAESGGCALAIAAWAGGGDCEFGSIAAYDRIDENCPPANGIEWMLDAPEARTFSMTGVLVHELGHVIGGYSDDYNNPNTVMQAGPPGAAPWLHLYNTDIRLFQDGDPAAGITGYGRRNHAVRFMHSTDAVNWIDDGTVIGWSYLRPAAAASPNSKVVAFVETLNTANTVQTRRYTAAGGWESPVSHVKSYTGPALAYQGVYVLAYAEEDDRRRIWVKTSDDGRTWSTPVLLHETARTQSDPALFANIAVQRVMAFWTDRDTDRLMYSSSTNGTAWEIPKEIDQNATQDPREYYSYRGPTGACDDNNQCLLVWPSWTTYGLANLGMCTLQMRFDANALQWNLLNLRCPDDGTGRTPGVAYGSPPGFTGWVLGFAGRDVNNTLATLRKSQHTTAEAWKDKTVLAWKNADGVAMIFNPTTSEFEVYLVSR